MLGLVLCCSGGLKYPLNNLFWETPLSKLELSRLDSELVEPFEQSFKADNGGLDLSDIHLARRHLPPMAAAEESAETRNIRVEDRRLPGPAGAPDAPVRIYSPADSPSPLPVLLWMHGGGYVMGDLKQDDQAAKSFSAAAKCLVVSVDYRLAPENPFPSAIEDCYAVLKRLYTQPDEFCIDPHQIAVGGASAGSGLAAGLALLARDRAEIPLKYQMLVYPMLDYRNISAPETESSRPCTWTWENNRAAWRYYLGQPSEKAVSPYASAAIASNLKGLPPAFIGVGGLDIFYQEAWDYTEKLSLSGVTTEFHMYPGAFHAFDMAVPGAALSRRFVAERCRALNLALHNS
jgi:acetyl esterase/lipase